MAPAIADLVPAGAEVGVGLALQDEQGRYLFFLAGTRHDCPPGELFYAGMGGHREAGEDWAACARREALEEVGTDVDLLPASATWHVLRDGSVRHVVLTDDPRPLALYEMVHPPGTRRAGEVYRIVIYRARLRGVPRDLPPEEVRGVIALTEEQVVRGLMGPVPLGELLEAGAGWVAGQAVDLETRIYPLGTARALGHVLAESKDA
ncbi:MAG TPA: NUDIX domain-containing protein [Anaerolineae bacterium]|nr:NUDIX domain-containing protein [Anaerolineae bacterium]